MWCEGNEEGWNTKGKPGGYCRHERSRIKKRKNRDEASRLAWSKVPVTITSFASVCGLFLSRRGVQLAKNTIMRHGSPSEDDLVEVLARHDGEIVLKSRLVQKCGKMKGTETCEGSVRSPRASCG